MSADMPIVIEDNWECYSFETDHGPVYVTFFAGVDSIDQSLFPHCARLLIPIRDPNQCGGPVEAEAERIYQLEDELIAFLQQNQVRCLQVARLTHSGIREVVFQLRDWESFRPRVQQWMKQVTDYDVELSEHPGWQYFDECIWPCEDDWMLIRDRHVVEKLIDAGSNPEKDHGIEVVFMGAPAKLQQVAARLAKRGYVPGASGSAEQLVMVKRMPLDLADIWSESVENRRAAAECQVDYDGWGAAVER